jgi:hypothetical protein
MLGLVSNDFFAIPYLDLYDSKSQADFDVTRGCYTKTGVYKVRSPIDNSILYCGS